MSHMFRNFIRDNVSMRGGHKSTLLALADFAHDAEGGKCWPGMAALSKSTGFSRRTCQRHIAQLESEGFIAVFRQAMPSKSGGRINHTNRYMLAVLPEELVLHARNKSRNYASAKAREIGVEHDTLSR